MSKDVERDKTRQSTSDSTVPFSALLSDAPRQVAGNDGPLFGPICGHQIQNLVILLQGKETGDNSCQHILEALYCAVQHTDSLLYCRVLYCTVTALVQEEGACRDSLWCRFWILGLCILAGRSGRMATEGPCHEASRHAIVRDQAPAGCQRRLDQHLHT